MGRGKPLTDYEQGLIDANSALVMSNRQIAVFIGRSLSVVNNYIKDPRHYGTKKPPGPPSLLSDRDKRNIVHKASNGISIESDPNIFDDPMVWLATPAVHFFRGFWLGSCIKRGHEIYSEWYTIRPQQQKWGREMNS
uniref:HTH_Tnp_Tc3_1 domain-containing protein n=1 Tax=Caenorhabditis japonica TaxID=281687 RepID=A0A8R1DQH7_CAEJA